MNIAPNWIAPLLSEPFVSSKYIFFQIIYFILNRLWSLKHIDLKANPSSKTVANLA